MWEVKKIKLYMCELARIVGQAEIKEESRRRSIKKQPTL